MKKRRIAILMHEHDNKNTSIRYVVNLLAEHWREDGHEVIYLFGTKQFVPADLIFVHVDLSVVPDAYFEFAEQYPVVVNGRVRDIRKSIFSKNLLSFNDDWQGPVIVKTEKNAAGVPERWRGGFMKKVQNKVLSTAGLKPHDLHLLKPRLKSPHDYPIYNRMEEVPRHYFFHPGLIVQKFVPETEDGFYCLRYMSFLGDRVTCTRLKGKHPIVTGSSAEVIKHSIEPHPEIIAMRNRLQFDYGKFDYVVADGEAILLDANKTVGCSPHLLDNEEMRERRRYRAEGLYSYF